MTLSGKQNYSNVKLLSGYGLSVILKNNRIVLTDGYDPFTKKQKKEKWFITQLPYEKLVISGKGYLSTEAIKLLNQNYKNVILTDTFGNPVSLMNGCMESMTGTKYRIGQYDAFRDPQKCSYLSRQIIIAKLESQIRFLASLDRTDSSETISRLQENLAEINDDSAKIEAKSGLVYFRYYSGLFDYKFKFTSRNKSNSTITKRGASDPINALLNYGYAVLAGEISKFVNGIGLDPYFGFMHKQDASFTSLIYDIIEPFRWLVESAVYHVGTTRDYLHKLRFKDFAWTKDGNVVLSNEIKRIFLEKLERVFHQEREYKFRFAKTKKNGLNNCQEITIAKIAVQNLADFCTGKQKEFRI